MFIQLTGATLFGFIIAATRRIVQFIAPIQKVTTTNLQVTAAHRQPVTTRSAQTAYDDLGRALLLA